MRKVLVPFRATGALRAALAAACLLGFPAAAQAPLDLRVALVIGNSAYSGPAALKNPANDAAAMSAALRKLGFDVTEVRGVENGRLTLC